MRRLALLVALLAMFALSPGVAAAGPAALGAAPPATTAAASGDAFAQSTVEPEATVTTDITVQLRADRDARWRVEMRYPLASENETAAFREYGEAFERGDADDALDAETFEYLANASSSVASRQMTIRNVSRSATVDDGVGVLRLSFTWTAFLSSDGELLVLRDALRLPDGRTWLGTLDSNQQLVIQTPPGYAINSTNAPVVQRSGSVIIDGPRAFDTDDPLTIRYEPRTGVAGYPWELVAGVGVALIVVLVVLARRQQRDTDTLLGGGSGPEAPDGAAEGTDQAAPETAAEPASGEEAVGGAGAEVGGAPVTGAEPEAGGAGEGEAPTEQPPEETDSSLLSDEERVEKLLERRGGRMRQAEIVEATGWSDAKVSQLLSSMVEEDRVEKLRLGRENLISLPEEESD